MLLKELFGVIFRVICRFGQVQAVNNVSAPILGWVCIGLVNIGLFFDFLPSFSLG